MPAAKKTSKTTAKKKSATRGAKSTRKAARAGAAKRRVPGIASPAKAGGTTGARLTREQAMAALRKAGTDQNRKVYVRHGVKGDMFGVSFANLRDMAKKIRTDHDLALALWETGNHDARMLATMIADAAKMSAADLNRWATDIDNYVLSGAFAGLAGRSPHLADLSDKWMSAKAEFMRAVGYGSISTALKDGADVSMDTLRGMIRSIEREIHSSANRAREAMNMALIAIGTYCDGLADEAIAAAKRIGPVKIDHGETACKDFDAVEYIAKSRAHRAKKAK